MQGRQRQNALTTMKKGKEDNLVNLRQPLISMRHRKRVLLEKC